MRILFVHTYYPEFLAGLCAEDSKLAESGYDEQLRRIFESGFGVADAYSHHLQLLGSDVADVICNADRLQNRWAADCGLKNLSDNPHDRRRRIVAAQIESIRPDVLFVFEWCPLGDAFLTEMKSRVRLLVGQIASPLPANRTFAAYDLMISSYPPIVEHFRGNGLRAEYLKLAFDSRVLERIEPAEFAHDVSFVGGFAPSHEDRVPFLEALLREFKVDIFGYGLERVPANSPIHEHYRGGAWGWKMYEVLSRSRITLNMHARIEIPGQRGGRYANNMRLYEATGAGTCLFTEARENLAEMFDPEFELVTFADPADCIFRMRNVLSDVARRAAIARAGQARTLRDHTYSIRMAELKRFLENR